MLPNNKWVTKDSKEIKMILGDKWKQNQTQLPKIYNKKQALIWKAYSGTGVTQEIRKTSNGHFNFTTKKELDINQTKPKVSRRIIMKIRR